MSANYQRHRPKQATNEIDNDVPDGQSDCNDVYRCYRQKDDSSRCPLKERLVEVKSVGPLAEARIATCSPVSTSTIEVHKVIK